MMEQIGSSKSESLYRNCDKASPRFRYLGEGQGKLLGRENIRKKGGTNFCCLAYFSKNEQSNKNDNNAIMEGLEIGEKGHHLVCKYYQIPNEIVHTSTMRLGNNGSEKNMHLCFEYLKYKNKADNPGVKETLILIEILLREIERDLSSLECSLRVLPIVSSSVEKEIISFKMCDEVAVTHDVLYDVLSKIKGTSRRILLYSDTTEVIVCVVCRPNFSSYHSVLVKQPCLSSGKIPNLYYHMCPDYFHEALCTFCQENRSSSFSCKNYVILCSHAKSVRQCCQKLHNAELIINLHEHLWHRLTKECMTTCLFKNYFDFSSNIFSCLILVLKLNHIYHEYVDALIRGNFYSIIIFSAWLKRLIFRSLDYKLLCNTEKNDFEMTDKVSDMNEEYSDIMSEPFQGICIHEDEKFENIPKIEERKDEHKYSQAVGDNSNGSVLGVETISIKKLNQLPQATVDLQTQNACSTHGKSHEDSSSDQEGKEIDPLKDIICHGNNMFPHMTDIVSAPVFNDKSNAEHPIETDRNDNDNLSETDSNTSMSRNHAMNNVSVTLGTPGSLSVDAHFLSGASGLTNRDRISSNVPDSSKPTADSHESCEISVVCPGDDMYPNMTDCEKSDAEQPNEIATNVVNDNDHLSASNSNAAISRNHTIINATQTQGSVFIDGHTLLGASGVSNEIKFSSKVPHTSATRDSHTGCDKPITNPEKDSAQNYENSEESSSQISETSNATGIPASDFPSPVVDRIELQRFEPLMHIINKIADGERVPPQITMRYEILRFCTLRSFPKNNKPYITRLAQAGFYYANTDDEVVCYCCARRKKNWCENDSPVEIHRELNPNCSFLLRNLEVNVPVRMSELLIQDSTRPANSQSHLTVSNIVSASTSSRMSQNISTTSSQSCLTANTPVQIVPQTTCISSPVVSTNNELLLNRMQPRAYGNFVHVTTSTAVPAVQDQQINQQINIVTTSNSNQSSPVVSSSLQSPTSQLSAQGNDTSTAPKYPQYANKMTRLTSYNDCGSIVIPPDSLATSGFFYAGFGDCVRCFQCGIGLRHWSEEDDPWIEHSRWSKDCLFVRQERGQEFVNLVQMAVQYSQTQNGNGQTSGSNTSGSNTESPSDSDIERQMQTDAAQSVLEMGYNPDIIRNALSALRNANDGRTLNATILMEKIFALEDEASETAENNQQVERTSLDQQETQAESTINNNTQGQRISCDSSATALSTTRSQSVMIEKKSSSAPLVTNTNSGTSRSQTKKSQLLEQKKLKEENEQLKQQSLCTKCKQNDVCIVFLPCGHLVTCETCAPTVKYCSVEGCGKYIKGTVRTYLA